MTSAPASSADAEFVRYATFTRRARAVLIDSAVLTASLVAVFMLADLASNIPGSGRLAWLAMFCLAMLYEPVLVSRRGATIGHAANDLVIVADETGRPPSFARALARYLGKFPLGVFGFVTMATTRRHQAVHDLLARTTVQVAPTADANTVEFHVERDDDRVVIPSRARRAIAIVGYVAVLYVVLGRIVHSSLSHTCITDGECSAGDIDLWRTMFTVLLILSAEIALAGWQGLLPGARSRRASDLGEDEHPEHEDGD